MVKASIIIAAYNVEKYIQKCIESCVCEEYLNEYEIIVVNDGSTDQTRSILDHLKETIKNIKIIHQENLGLGASRNTGLKYSKGEFVWFLDGDDYIKENIIPTLLDVIYVKKLDILVLDYAITNEDRTEVSTYCNKITNIEEGDVVTGAFFYSENYTQSYTWLFIFKRRLFTNKHILFKERINMQDSEILPRLLAQTKRLAYINKVCYYYVQHKVSFTNNVKGEKRYFYFKSIIEVRDTLNKFLKQEEDIDPLLVVGIKRKVRALDEVVFNHLIHFSYNRYWMHKIITLLRKHDFYPLKWDGNGKTIKLALNYIPYTTNRTIHNYKRIKAWLR